MLRINKEKLMNEIFNVFTVELFNSLEGWESDVNKFNGSIPSFASNAKVRYEINKEAYRVVAYLKANPAMLAVAYGTGSLMLESNPGLKKYKANKPLWNPLRQGNAIVGRAKGAYPNIFRKEGKSKGRVAGKNIEDKITLLKPTNSIQDANKFLYQSRIPKAWKATMQKVNISKFVEEVNS